MKSTVLKREEKEIKSKIEESLKKDTTAKEIDKVAAYLKARKDISVSELIPYQVDVDIDEEYIKNPYVIYKSEVAADYVKYYLKDDRINPNDYCIYVISKEDYDKRMEELGKSYKAPKGSRAEFMGLTWDDYDELERHMFVLRSFNLELTKRRKAGEDIDIFAHCLHEDTWKKKEELIKEEHRMVLKLLTKRGWSYMEKTKYGYLSLLEIYTLKANIDLDLKGLILGYIDKVGAANIKESLLFELQIIIFGLGTYDKERVKSKLIFMNDNPTYNFESLKADVKLYSDSLFNLGAGRI